MRNPFQTRDFAYVPLSDIAGISGLTKEINGKKRVLPTLNVAPYSFEWHTGQQLTPEGYNALNEFIVHHSGSERADLEQWWYSVHDGWVVNKDAQGMPVVLEEQRTYIVDEKLPAQLHRTVRKAGENIKRGTRRGMYGAYELARHPLQWCKNHPLTVTVAGLGILLRSYAYFFPAHASQILTPTGDFIDNTVLYRFARTGGSSAPDAETLKHDVRNIVGLTGAVLAYGRNALRGWRKEEVAKHLLQTEKTQLDSLEDVYANVSADDIREESNRA